MKQLFEHSKSFWVRYSDYAIVEDSNGIKYLKVAENARPDLYDPIDSLEEIVVKALNVGRICMGIDRPDEEKDEAVFQFVKEYGFLGLMTAIPTTPRFLSCDNVFLPKNQFIKRESMEVFEYLAHFYPFERPRVPRPLEEIKLEEIDDFYEQGLLSLDQLAEIENVPEAQKKKVAEMYSSVTKPFYYSGFYDVQVLEYIMFYVLLIVLIGVLLSSTIFSKDYESGADQIFRCSKNGKMKLAIARIAAVTTVNIGMYCVTTTIHLAISYWAFGTSYFESSVWMYGGEPLVTMNILQMHIASILGGLLSLLAGSGMAYFISSKMEKSAPSIAIAFLLFLSPIVIYYAAGGNNWLTAILPTGGVGIHTSMYYTICDYRLLNIGSCCFWTPQVTMTFTLLWIPVFMILAGRSYCKHKIR